MFNLYFAGSQSRPPEQLIEDRKYKRLLSYVNDKRHIEDRREKQLLTFVDSGAYSSHTRGIHLDVDEYIQYTNERDPVIEMFAQVDKIPASSSKQDVEQAAKQTWENYLYMRERVNSPQKLVPVFHRGEDFKNLLNILDYPEELTFLALGALVGVPTKQREMFIEKSFTLIQKYRPSLKIHGFGMTNLSLLEQFPFYSADSTSWIMTAINGAIMSPFGVVLVSDQKTHEPGHLFNIAPALQEQVIQYVKSFGFDVQDLSKEHARRCMLNIEYLANWATNYKYKPKSVKQKRLF